MIALLLAAQLVLPQITCTDDFTGRLVCTDGTSTFEGFTRLPPNDTTTHRDRWWFWALAGGYVACVAADVSTSAYVFGAEKGYERNVLYQDVQHQPLRFGLRRAAFGLVPGALALTLHKRGGRGGRIASVVILGAGAGAACGIAVHNNRIALR